MTGLVRKATLFGACGLLVASVALAGIPDPAQSPPPSTIYVATSWAGGPNGVDVDGADGPAGTSNQITIRDFAGNPIAGVVVRFTFPCDINLCDPNVLNPGAPYTTTYAQTVGTAGGFNYLEVTTDPFGVARFVALGGSKVFGPDLPNGGGGGGGFGSTTITTVPAASGAFPGVTTAAINNDGGSNGSAVTAIDAGHVLGIFLNGVPRWGSNQKARANLNGDGTITAIDAGVDLAHFFRIGSGTTASCAGGYLAKNACP
jgi:hypothetical protein